MSYTIYTTPHSVAPQPGCHY